MSEGFPSHSSTRFSIGFAELGDDHLLDFADRVNRTDQDKGSST
jgi:hypothetical protein